MAWGAIIDACEKVGRVLYSGIWGYLGLASKLLKGGLNWDYLGVYYRSYYGGSSCEKVETLEVGISPNKYTPKSRPTYERNPEALSITHSH